MSMAGLKHYLRKRGGWFFFLSSRGVLRHMPDEPYLKLLYRCAMGRPLDLEHPKSYNEKLQWLKLHDRDPLYTRLVDKLAVKDYVAEKIGAEYVIPVIGGPWDSAGEIDFDALPEQFVLKCTHDSGGVVICRDKAQFDREAARAKLERALRRSFFQLYREWPYKDVKPRVFAERYLEDAKLYTFRGRTRFVLVAGDRNTGRVPGYDYYDQDFRHLPFRRGHANAPTPPAPPAGFAHMKELASVLGGDFPHVRVDFYELDGRVYFGELTFYPGSGLAPFDPPEWDAWAGRFLTLPEAAQEAPDR